LGGGDGTCPGGCGTVFEITASGVESVLYSFEGSPSDGAGPGGSLLRDASGNIYGVAGGGANDVGVVFRLTSGGAETVLLNFNLDASGDYPFGGLVRDAAGNFYGSTAYGGSGAGCGERSPAGCGVLFELTASGTEVVLHDFQGNQTSDGTWPSGVVRDPLGDLYGTLYYGGAYGCGAVFKYTP
jgi:uncharacterized repeat protein (TIGR03803 family)